MLCSPCLFVSEFMAADLGASGGGKDIEVLFHRLIKIGASTILDLLSLVHVVDLSFQCSSLAETDLESSSSARVLFSTSDLRDSEAEGVGVEVNIHLNTLVQALYGILCRFRGLDLFWISDKQVTAFGAWHVSLWQGKRIVCEISGLPNPVYNANASDTASPE
jgi:hypothetical protein